jgi:uncharacterized membrane protein
MKLKETNQRPGPKGAVELVNNNNSFLIYLHANITAQKANYKMSTSKEKTKTKHIQTYYKNKEIYVMMMIVIIIHSTFL